MIDERVMVEKADGSRYFAVGLRWESKDVFVVRPEDGSAVEKRAYLPVDKVTLAGAPTPGKRWDISKMQHESDKVAGWKSKFKDMT